jgi:hypothetical protein
MVPDGRSYRPDPAPPHPGPSVAYRQFAPRLDADQCGHRWPDRRRCHQDERLNIPAIPTLCCETGL